MPEMPTLGAQPKKSAAPAIAIFAMLVGSVAGGAYWYTNREALNGANTPGEPAGTAARAEGSATSPPAQSAPSATGISAADLNAVVVANAPVAVAAPAIAPPLAKAGIKAFAVTINGPVESAIISATNKEAGTALTQVVTRSLVWWVKVPGDLLRGDTLSGLYEERVGQEPLVHAVRFNSRKFGKVFEAYRYKVPGTDFARFYQPDGAELEEHLVDSPLENWEQITSLLRDGRKHKGVDFKTPVGTDVHSTFDGTIVRKNWNFRGNGNSLEVRESGGQGRTALYLHLSELLKNVQVGDHVKKGQVLAKSGNTGHSFAPHLHYQLMQGDKVLDPFKSHSVSHLKLKPEEQLQFDVAVATLRAQMPTEPLAGAGG